MTLGQNLGQHGRSREDVLRAEVARLRKREEDVLSLAKKSLQELRHGEDASGTFESLDGKLSSIIRLIEGGAT